MSMNQGTLIKWVILGKLAGSAFPLSRELLTAPELNIMLVVSLTRQGIPNRLKDQLRAHGVRWKRFPIPDFGVPSPTTITQYLESVCNTIQENQAVLTPCLAGCGRTGTMIGLFLITHGYSLENALRKIHEVIGINCPETEEQIELLYDYNKKCPNYSQCEGTMK